MIGKNVSELKKELGTVKLVAVTKGRSIRDILEAIASGARIIGENRVDEAETKFSELKEHDVKIHLIGHLQSNKVSRAVKIFDVIETVDSYELAKKIDDAALRIGKVQEIFVQVNIGEEAQKSGIKKEDCINLVKDVSTFSNLSLTGLMCIPPYSEDPEMARIYFRQMQDLFKESRTFNKKISNLSMGMTNDYKIAVEEGSNMVRIGRKIFENEILNKDEM